eukprot:gene14140-10097_t
MSATASAAASADAIELVDLVGENNDEPDQQTVSGVQAPQISHLDKFTTLNRKRKRADSDEENELLAINSQSFRQRLEQDERFQVDDLGGGSWVAICRRFYVPPKAVFDATWALHPREHKVIKMFGKDTPIPRYQQAYGQSYAFSGIVSEALPVTPVIQELFDQLNALLPAPAQPQPPTQRPLTRMEFNACLCNWYEPHHYIGAHSDDTRQLVPYSPVASLSWGATRTFLLTPRDKAAKGLHTRELSLMNGDLVFMGGRCQETHKHEIVKLRKWQLGANRINFSIRCFK